MEFGRRGVREQKVAKRITKGKAEIEAQTSLSLRTRREDHTQAEEQDRKGNFQKEIPWQAGMGPEDLKV